ncbi:alkylation response protein AidB-like acyl-CoA dehydrogenase [Thermoflavifilum aggregans]|uniref:Cyclohex-1-ene-1-carbonyl-CoA dehydrogenase n=1 Tax=Thermoflavifilum aggregans TaxID=454188 RepID=A0A2M9CTA3_9BACT|nr:acyl-CoA dehydrogenase family protein [Thermoflavifilum aggregans]PJJ75144.1 alkylation response protein AidB-like acyl-CoA dehydrogenase [Thermoflavifilum aggregans]
MHLDLNEFQLQIAETFREFAQKRIQPHVMEWDEGQHFPRDLFRELGAMGAMGVLVPAQYGGSGLGYVEYVLIVRELAKVCGAVALSVAAHNSLCTGHILQFGNEFQKQKYLPKLASGEWLGAWGLTEANTGSDALHMKTTARQDGNDWLLEGTKSWITHGQSADVAVVMARTGEPGDSHGISAFIVERGTPGFRGGKKENKLGMRASETAEMIFERCRVPAENLLGQLHEGFVQALQVLDGGRISIAALSLGIAEGAYEAAKNYAQVRHQFNQPIANFQGIAFKLADMATQIQAAELLVLEAAARKDAGEKITQLAAMAKYYASELAVQVATDAVQIFGAYGYTKDYPAEKFYRDAKLCTIGEGTSEIQKIVIAREALKVIDSIAG